MGINCIPWNKTGTYFTSHTYFFFAQAPEISRSRYRNYQMQIFFMNRIKNRWLYSNPVFLSEELPWGSVKRTVYLFFHLSVLFYLCEVCYAISFVKFCFFCRRLTERWVGVIMPITGACTFTRSNGGQTWYTRWALLWPNYTCVINTHCLSATHARGNLSPLLLCLGFIHTGTFRDKCP